jgi:hypothetical protein
LYFDEGVSFVQSAHLFFQTCKPQMPKVTATKQESTSPKSKPTKKPSKKPEPEPIDLDSSEDEPSPTPVPRKRTKKVVEESKSPKKPSAPKGTKAKSPTATASKSSKSSNTAPTKKSNTSAKAKAEPPAPSKSKGKKKVTMDLDSDEEPSSSPAPAEERPLFPKNAFQFFCLAKRPTLVAEQPDMTHKERMAEMSRMWNDMGESERAPFAKQASEDKARFDADCARIGNVPERKRKSKDGDQAPKRRKKDPNAPKGASNAYIMFGQAERQRLVKADPDLSSNAKELMRAVAARWNELSDLEKAPYNKMAAEDKARYEREKAAMEAN